MRRVDGVPMQAQTLKQSDAAGCLRTTKQRVKMIERVLGHVTKHPGCTWRDVAGRYGWSMGSALPAVKLAVQHGAITQDEHGALRPRHPDDCRCAACWEEGTPLSPDEAQLEFFGRPASARSAVPDPWEWHKDHVESQPEDGLHGWVAYPCPGLWLHVLYDAEARPRWCWWVDRMDNEGAGTQVSRVKGVATTKKGAQEAARREAER